MIEDIPDVGSLGGFGSLFLGERNKFRILGELTCRRAGPVFNVRFLAAGVAWKGEQYVFADMGCQVQCGLSFPGLLRVVFVEIDTIGKPLTAACAFKFKPCGDASLHDDPRAVDTDIKRKFNRADIVRGLLSAQVEEIVAEFSFEELSSGGEFVEVDVVKHDREERLKFFEHEGPVFPKIRCAGPESENKSEREQDRDNGFAAGEGNIKKRPGPLHGALSAGVHDQ